MPRGPSPNSLTFEAPAPRPPGHSSFRQPPNLAPGGASTDDGRLHSSREP
jgi:hypothetical protein